MKIAASDRPASPPPAGSSVREVSLRDLDSLAVLMDRAYSGTIDHEGETLEQCRAEMEGTLTGKYGRFLGQCSFVAERAGTVLSASLITFWKENPLLAYSMTDPSAQGLGLAKALIARSIAALAREGHSQLYLVVTEGNTAAETLYRKLGFTALGPALPGEPPPRD